MLASKKFLSLPIISLKEGQQIGYVRNLVINPKTKSIAALMVDPKGFFKEQRIIPFHRVVSLGENAITINNGSQVEKAANLPDILDLLKDKASVLGVKVITESGKTLGVTDEFYIDPESGQICAIDISEGKIEGLFNGKARLMSEDILTLGPDVIVVDSDCNSRLEMQSKGLNENFKSFISMASGKAAEKRRNLTDYWKKIKQGKTRTEADEESSDIQEDIKDHTINKDDDYNEGFAPQEKESVEVWEEKDKDKKEIS